MKSIYIYLGIGLFVGLIVSFITAVMVESTGDDEFCGSCHTMEIPVLSFNESQHGGNNQYGLNVKCVDCHLPHDGMLNYIVQKGLTGFHDAWQEVFLDKENFDWIKNLENREKFTYSSGCEKCHKLDDIKMEIPKAFQSHRDYKMGKVTNCIKCHEHVGHKDIIDYYKKAKLKLD